mgnify:CR=1 FL=1
MKTMIMVLILTTVLLNTLPASAGMFMQVEGQMILQNGKEKPQINAVVNVPITGSLTLTGFGLVKQGWSQFHVGPTWSPSKHCQFGLRAGVEQAHGMWRTAGTLWMGNGTVSSFSVYERGAGGSWYKSVTTVPVLANTRLGLFGQKFAGWGLVVEYKLVHGKVWAAELLRSNETPTVIIALDVTN